jgi:Na+/H+ antiporter NhaD/arsenite permease-like protein
MIFTILHCTLLFLLFLPLYVEMNRDDWDDEQTEARITRVSRTLFSFGIAAFAVCVVYDFFVWRSFTMQDWLFVGFIGLFSLWRFGDYLWRFRRRRGPERKDDK